MMSMRRWLTAQYDFTGISKLFYRSWKVELFAILLVALLTGLGFFLYDINGHRLVGHTGDQGGFRSFMAFDPASGQGVIGVVNTSNDVDESASGRGFTSLFRSALKLLAQ
jgi:CubicO group peptidase (beta-lactamase class C family)